MPHYPYAYTEHVIGMRIMSPFSQIYISIVNIETITMFFLFCFKLALLQVCIFNSQKAQNDV